MLKWNGDHALEFVEGACWEGIQRATVFLHAQCQQALNVSNPRPYDSPSRPGEAPRKRTGFLQRNTLYDLSKVELRGRVGVRQNAMYGLFLELGTRHIDPRPWLWATVRRTWSTLAQLASSGGSP